jgi:small-conductance mechanosensitive channel
MARKFKVGDKVTYKYQKDLPEGSYRYGGTCQGGYVGTVKQIVDKNKIFVTYNDDGDLFSMQPSEFVEYDGPSDNYEIY